MFLWGFRKHQDVIKVDQDELVQVWAQDSVHQGLEGRRGMEETKGDDCPREVTIFGPKSSFGDVVTSHP
jgi:hypothetical protein